MSLLAKRTRLRLAVGVLVFMASLTVAAFIMQRSFVECLGAFAGQGIGIVWVYISGETRRPSGE